MKNGEATADLFDRKRTAKQIVEEYEPSPETRAWAALKAPSVPVEDELEDWRYRCREGDYKRGRSIPIADADASFRHACLNAERWGVYRKHANLRVLKKPGSSPEPSEVVRQLMLRGGQK